MPLNTQTKEIYQYALANLETEKARLEALIYEINRQLFGSSASAPTVTPSDEAPVAKTATRKKRAISPEGKARMVAAQTKRWNDFHAKQKETTDMLAKLERNAKKAGKKVTKKTAKKKASDIPF